MLRFARRDTDGGFMVVEGLLMCGVMTVVWTVVNINCPSFASRAGVCRVGNSNVKVGN